MTGYTLLVNPACGGGSGAVAAESVAQTLRGAGHDVKVSPTPSVRGTLNLVDDAAARSDVIVLVGGDGTLSSLAGRVAARGGTLGIVPAGRGNDFARMLGLPTAPAAAAEVLLSGSPKTVDLLQVTIPGDEPRVIAGSAYSGLDARAGEIVNTVRWMPVRLSIRIQPCTRWRLTARPAFEWRSTVTARSTSGHRLSSRTRRTTATA